MAFALFYNREDLTPISAEVTRATLPQGEKQFALACWHAGIDGWDTAPIAPLEKQEGDPDTRILVVSGNFQGSPITLQAFRDFLYRMSANPGAIYLSALADDMGGSSGAIEPWP